MSEPTSTPPPLPDTDDPYELLGIDAAADARAIRAAYARRIKVYRPDRHPEEFQRIHAAFEAARAMLEAPAVLRLGSPAAAAGAAAVPAPAAPAPSPLGVLGAASRLEAAITCGDEPAMGAALDALVADGFTVDRVFALISDAGRAALLASPAMTWSRIERAGRGAAALLQRVIAWRIAAGASASVPPMFDAAWSAAAARDPRLVEIGWRAAAALIWFEPIDPLLRALREATAACPPDPGVDRAKDLAMLDVRAAAAMRGSDVTLPGPLRRLFAAERLEDRAACRRLADRIHARMIGATGETLGIFDRVAIVRHELVGALRDRFGDVPAHRRDPAAIKSTTAAYLASMIPPPRFRWHTIAVSVALVLAGAGLAMFGMSRATVPALLAAVVVFGIGDHVLPYRRERPRYAAMAIHGGLTIEVLCGWLRANDEIAGNRRWHAWMLRRDRGMRLTCAAAAWAAALAEVADDG
jgi:hypothetical protein